MPWHPRCSVAWTALWAAAGFVLTAGSAAGQAPVAARTARAAHTTVELITAGGALEQGAVVAGIRFRLDAGWHLYWLNPGDSGNPPTVRWQLPDGWSAGDFEWPVPERIPLGPLVNYGYHGDVVLPVRLNPPGSGVGRALVSATLKWLVCQEICVPGQARLTLALAPTGASGSSWVPVADQDRAQVGAWRAAIDAARRRVPRPVPAAWRVTAASRGDTFVVTLVLDRAAPTRAIFFPLELNQVNDSAPQQVSAAGREMRLTLRKSDLLTALPGTLRGVVAFSGDEGYVVAARLQAPAARE